MRTIITTQGIGDILWVFMKLVNQPEKINWKISDSLPQRGEQVFKLFPQLTESFEYIPQAGYKKVKRNGYWGKWADAPQNFYLEANSLLELGHRIEKFLPDLPTTYKLDYATTYEDEGTALELLCFDYIDTDCGKLYGGMIEPLIGIYTSAYSNARHWGGWQAHEWLQLVNMINKLDKGYKFVLIGAEYDIGIPELIMQSLKPEQYINTIGQPLSVVIEILKRLDCFIGFPSGLSIINETLAAKQTVMFYPPHLKKLINAWPDPERIENGSYKGCEFCDPKLIFDWLINNNKI